MRDEISIHAFLVRHKYDTSCVYFILYILTNIATFAPSLLHIRAIALPIPRPPPVTRTRWPAKRADDVIMAEEEVMDSRDVIDSSEDRRNDAIINNFGIDVM